MKKGKPSMTILFTQEWDIVRGKEDAYEAFITNEFTRRLNDLGLKPVGGFYVEVGFGPRIISVRSMESLTDLLKIFDRDGYKNLILDLQEFITNYRNRVLRPTGRVPLKEYTIQKGVWKYIHYWNQLPGKRSAYEEFISREYLPILYSIDYLEVTNSWDVLLGGFSQIAGELTFKSAVDVGRFLEDPTFRKINETLRRNYVYNYATRIIRTTGRFDEPKWYRL
jgi:hypothetical protein